MTITSPGDTSTSSTFVRPTPGELGGPHYRKVWNIGRDNIIQYGVLIVLAVFVLAPIVPTLYQSVIDRPLYEAGGILTLDNYVRLFSEAGFGRVIFDTVLFAGLTVILAQLFAVPTAIVVTRTKLPLGRLVAGSMRWPFYISSLLLGFGWIMLYGPAGFASVQMRELLGFVPWNLYSIPGMAVTEAVALAPIAFTFCVGALYQSDASLESAAQVCGAGPVRILWSVVVPLLRPPIVYSSVLIISMSIETLSVPLLYGLPSEITVFSTFLYTNGLQSIDPDYGVLGAASVIILLVTVALVTMQSRLLKNSQRFVTVRGKATRPRTFDLGWIKWISVAFIGIYLIFGALLPIAALVFRSFTLVLTPLKSPFSTLTFENYQPIFSYTAYYMSIINSIVIAVIGAVVVSVLATLAVLVARRSKMKANKLVEYLALAPQAMPGLIVGIGFFWALAYSPGWISGLLTGTVWILVIAFGLRALPTAYGNISPMLMQIGAELDNAARVSGADWFKTFSRVLGKLIVPAFAGALILVFVTMIKEYSPAIFLANSRTSVIGTTALQLWAEGNTGSVAALASVQIAITIIFVAIATRLLKGQTTHA
jgi:iron(III) transport system permease protein